MKKKTIKNPKAHCIPPTPKKYLIRACSAMQRTTTFVDLQNKQIVNGINAMPNIK